MEAGPIHEDAVGEGAYSSLNAFTTSAAFFESTFKIDESLDRRA